MQKTKKQLIQKWMKIVNNDLDLDVNMETFNNLVDNDLLQIEELDGDIGVFSYIIVKSFLNVTMLSDYILYLKPEHRNIRNFKKILDLAEKLAQDNNCDELVLGNSIGYDERVSKLYKRCGFQERGFVKCVTQ